LRRRHPAGGGLGLNNRLQFGHGFVTRIHGGLAMAIEVLAGTLQLHFGAS
jgi:hypothetical protein